MAMIATTAMQNSTLQFKMAGNRYFREVAFQQAQGIATAIAADAASFPVQGNVGHTICASGCDTNTTAMAAIVATAVGPMPPGVTIRYRVERQAPWLLESLPFRQLESVVSSSTAFDVALFETSVEVDGNSVHLGRAAVVQGVAVLVASANQ